MRVCVADKMQVSGTRRTQDGYLLTDARIARTGIYEYAGHQVGKPHMPTVRVYRDEALVFSDENMATFAYKPVTLGHPTGNVTASNWRDLARGVTSGDIVRDGEFVRVPLMLTDAETIARVEAGEAELSAGYAVDFVDEAGTAPDGQAYDMRMAGTILANHVAIVPRGRAGPQCRIGDAFTFGDAEMTLKTLIVDGLPVEVNAAAEAVIALRDSQLADARNEVATLTAATTALDEQIASLTTQLADATVTPQMLADMAAVRAATVADAKAKAPDVAVADDMTDSAIRAAVVKAKLGDKANGWTDAQINAAFDALPSATPADGRNLIGDATVNLTDARSVADTAYAKSVERFKRH